MVSPLCVTIFVEIILSHSAEKIAGKPFRVTLVLGYRIILCFRGLYHSFSSKFLSHSTENLCREPICGVFWKISGSQKIYG